MTVTIPASITVADFITARLAETDKTQREIAEECGFENPNIISMFKNGTTKVPLNRAVVLATALGVDPAHFLRLIVNEYFPETWAAIESVMKSTILTANELELIRSYRAVTGDNDAAAVVIKGDAALSIVSA